MEVEIAEVGKRTEENDLFDMEMLKLSGLKY